MDLAGRICDRARDLEFDLVGVAPASLEHHGAAHLDGYLGWIAQGYHGGMGYMVRPDRVERREDPTRILPGAASVICVGLNYYPGALDPELGRDPARGLISNYAWGLDYHDVMIPRLERLAEFACTELSARLGRKVSHRVYVDTGPVLERAYAAQAGLGFVGKNTCLIHPKTGSWVFLGEILVDAEITPTSARVGIGCGTCRKCLDACPTGALVRPYVLDARRCISYLTIELKGAIPYSLRPLMGNWVYGCDVCQTVCPWQRFARPTGEAHFLAGGSDYAAPELLDLMAMDEDGFRQRYDGTPIERIGRRRLVRNAAVALGNWGSPRAIPVLARALSSRDEDPLVRGHAAWALGRIGEPPAWDVLNKTLQNEQEPSVRQEILAAADQD